MALNKFFFQRGDPIVIDLVVEDAGAVSPGACTVAMKLKRASNNAPPPRTTAAVANLLVAYTGPAGNSPGFWRGSIPAGASANLAPATYVADAEISLGGSVIDVSDPILVEVAESVTPA